jgi:thiol-disulfide isomerase/thioredoxin
MSSFPRASFAAAVLLAILSGFVLLSRGDEPKTPEKAEITLTVVKMPQLTAALESHQGKVVVADIWGTFCPPCKKAFPRLVELHRKYAKDGVLCVSVSLDSPDDREAALTFLKEKGATFPNYLLDEDTAVWQNTWKFKGPPAVRVYGPDGKLARQFDYDDPNNQFDYKDVQQLVQKLLQEKK